MQDLAELNTLIDAAAKRAGSDYKLAQQLGQTRQRISNWRHGAQTCPPEDQALMAAVAGFDPMAQLARAVVAKHEGKAKGDLLMKVLGKGLAATGGMVVSAGASAMEIYSWTIHSGLLSRVVDHALALYDVYTCKVIHRMRAA